MFKNLISRVTATEDINSRKQDNVYDDIGFNVIGSKNFECQRIIKYKHFKYLPTYQGI